MRHQAPTTEQDRYSDGYDDEPSAFSPARIFAILREYRAAIGLSLLVVTVGYALIASIIFLRAPSSKTTAQPFRLDFEGATTGTYPNGVRFSTANIVNTPILLRVYRQNDLQRFLTFSEFARSVFVLEHNAAYEALASEYRARLADPKLTPVDRERITSDFESKRASLAKNDYAVHFVHGKETADVPSRLVRKVLTDVLTTWANHAVKEQHVLMHRMAVLSPSVIDTTSIQSDHLVAAVHVLRARISRVIADIEALEATPGAALIRTSKERMTLGEIKLRLEDINRFRLEPIVPLLRISGVEDPSRARQFLETQLSFDRRNLEARRSRVDAIRATLAAYAMNRTSLSPDAAPPQPATEKPAEEPAVVPQLSDSFIDRLVALTNQSADIAYRQRLADDLREAAEALGPAQQAVAYDEEMLRLVNAAPGTSAADGATLRADLEATRAEVRELIVRLNEIHRLVSDNMNPATELFTLTGVAVTTAERAVDLPKLLSGGLLAVLAAAVVAVASALLHSRLREEGDHSAPAAPEARQASAS